MTDLKRVPLEKPQSALEKTEIAAQNYEAIEKIAETESRREEELIDELAQLRAKMSFAPATATPGRPAVLDDDIEARKKKIVDSFVKAALASDFADDKMKHIMSIVERYIKKDHPDIADEVHDRILEAKNKGMH
jgi:tRNA 2-selenouridine synthase SelU